MDFKELNNQVKMILEDEQTQELDVKNLFGYLPQGTPDGLATPNNNNIYLSVEDGRIFGQDDQWGGESDFKFELDPEICKNKETLLNKLKELKIFHPETIDVTRCNIREPQDFIILYGCVDPQNPKIRIVTQSGGRGTTSVFLRNATGDPAKDAVLSLGYNIKHFETVKETPMGTLVFL